MITVDTEVCENFASMISSMMRSEWFENSIFASRHDTIQSLLQSLSSFFLRLSEMSKETEDSLCWKITGSIPASSGFSLSTSGYGSAQRLLDGYSVSRKATATIALAQLRSEYNGEYLQSYAAAGVLEGTVTGKASARFFKNGSFNPSIELSAEASGHVLGAGAGVSLGTDNLNLSADGIVEVGAVYAKAKCVISKEKQELSVKVGAAAVRGACTFALNIFGVKISLELGGSLLSAEYGFEYKSSSDEWEIGAKLGFIAGISGKLKIEFD